MEHGESWVERRTGEVLLNPKTRVRDRCEALELPQQFSIEQPNLSRAMALWPVTDHTSNT